MRNKLEIKQLFITKAWYLIWDPRKEKEPSRLNFKETILCAPTLFKTLSKRIQGELELAFFNHFRLYNMETEVDYYKLSNSFCDLNNGADRDIN